MLKTRKKWLENKIKNISQTFFSLLLEKYSKNNDLANTNVFVAKIFRNLRRFAFQITSEIKIKKQFFEF